MTHIRASRVRLASAAWRPSSRFRAVPQWGMVAAFVLAWSAFAARPVPAAAEITLYRGEPVATQGITLGSWGSGYAAESQRVFMTGSHSLELSTDGYFAGGRLDFTTPVDMTDAFAEPNAYLVIMAKFQGIGEDNDYSAGSGYSRSSIAPGQASTGEAAGPKMSFFRVVATVNGQNLVAEDQPVDITNTESGWTTLSVPLSALKGPRTPGRSMLSRLVIFGDRPDKFNIGDIHTSIDESDLYLDESPEEQTVGPGDPVQITAVASGGLASVEYIWDFNRTDGLQEEAYGSTAYHTFTNLGDYTVTLRVRDINGVKPELREEFKVTVAL